MLDLHYLKLLSDRYPNISSAAAEMINLLTVAGMPKGTEYFFSDLHGEHEAFIYQLKSASGVIKMRIDELFYQSMTVADRKALAVLVYEPENVLKTIPEGEEFEEWFRLKVSVLIELFRDFAGKYTISRINKKIPEEFAQIIDEFLYFRGANKEFHFRRIIQAILTAGVARDFMIALCKMIRDISVDRLHIIGDIFDRGPRADLIMDELMSFHDVDIQWGNHDIAWMGAVSGNLTCIASVIRTGISYNNFDCLEDGYGINLRPLSMFASEIYKDDDCSAFLPHLLDESKYDRVRSDLAAKMHKAIAVIQFKLEGQLYRRHPEYDMDDRDILSRVDFKNNTVTLDGKTYKLHNFNLPTVDPVNPLQLTPDEENLMNTLAASFMHSSRLQKHIRFLYEKGSMFLVYNNNLLYHGCIPMTDDGEFENVSFGTELMCGKKYLEYINDAVRTAYFSPHEVNSKSTDFFWYLWCGKKSPLFGKSKMAAFERYFINDKELSEELMNVYYSLIERRDICKRILNEFSLDENCHIINGHVPVKAGENPVKGDGLLFMIDGGIAKAYQPKTGIGGYTFIFSSRYMAFAKHSPDEWKAKEIPSICEVERMKKRMLIDDTDDGIIIRERISELAALTDAYRSGLIKERR
ncbi:MAG: fructose-1,6-bisphosphatase [Clostridia bacterium]|nr:fructose-1,6-bisphosphatase [Clostridia bacterium]